MYMLHSKLSTIIEDCHDYWPDAARIIFRMKLRLQGTGKYREVLEKRGCGRLENTETTEKQAST